MISVKEIVFIESVDTGRVVARITQLDQPIDVIIEGYNG